MKLTRRVALLTGVGLIGSAYIARPRWALGDDAAQPSRLLLTVSGIRAEDAPLRLAGLIDPLLRRNIPIFLGFNPFRLDGAALSRDSDLAVWLRRNIEEYKSVVEVGLDLSLDPPDPYSELRHVSEAQAIFTAAMSPLGIQPLEPIVTALTLTTTQNVAKPAGGVIRGAGIRTIIRVPAAGIGGGQVLAMDAKLANTGLLNLYAGAGASAPLGKTGAPVEPALLRAAVTSSRGGSGALVINIPYASLAGFTEAEISVFVANLAQLVQELTDDQRLAIALPVAFYQATTGRSGQHVFLRVDDLRVSASTDPFHMEFTRSLLDKGIPLTEAVIPAPAGFLLSDDEISRSYLRQQSARASYDAAVHGWRHTPYEFQALTVEESSELVARGVKELYRATNIIPSTFIPPYDIFIGSTLEAMARAGLGVLSGEVGTYTWMTGLDKLGILHLSNSVRFEKSWEGDFPYQDTDWVLNRIGALNDAVLCVHPQTINSDEKMLQVRNTIEALASRPNGLAPPMNTYAREILSTAPAVQIVQQARAQAVIAVDAVATLNETQLKEDAATAWSYFDWGMARYNARIAPATGWYEYGKPEGYPFTTMWDMGSLILAHVAARSLGLIDDLRIEAAMTRALAFLGEASYFYVGARLPPAERALGSIGGERGGFDAADTGRLLVALKVLDNFTAQSLPIASLIKTWGLDSTIIDGKMQSIANGKPVLAHETSYANYVAQGYALWGLRLAPVFGNLNPSQSMDDAVAMLAEVRRRGRIATEPHVTEEVELGASPHGRFMADILFAAQVKRYRETGKLTGISEGTVSGAPFFVYQGYQVEETGGSWHVDAPPTDAAGATAKRGESLRFVSSKAAYLWHAARPGEYSRSLVELVRTQAKMGVLGFASGVFEGSGKHTQVSDINTNAIILEAIAYILKRRTPLVSIDNDASSISRDSLQAQSASHLKHGF